MSEQIKQFQFNAVQEFYDDIDRESCVLGTVTECPNGAYILHADHLAALEAARAADKAEIEGLRTLVAECWQEANGGPREAHESDDELPGIIATHRVARERLRARAEKAEARIAELEAIQDEAVRRDAAQWPSIWLQKRLDGRCTVEIEFEPGQWAKIIDDNGDIISHAVHHGGIAKAIAGVAK